MESIDFRVWGMVLVMIGPWLFSVVDALSRPEMRWIRANHNKALWVLAFLVLPFVAAPGYRCTAVRRTSSLVAPRVTL